MNKPLLTLPDRPSPSKLPKAKPSNLNLEIDQIISLKIELHDLKIFPKSKIYDISPYFTFTIGEESTKTEVGKSAGSRSFSFHGLSATQVDLSDPTCLEMRQLLFDDENGNPIGSLNLKFRATQVTYHPNTGRVGQLQSSGQKVLSTMPDMRQASPKTNQANDTNGFMIEHKIPQFEVRSNALERLSLRDDQLLKGGGSQSTTSSKNLSNILKSQIEYQTTLKQIRGSEESIANSDVETLKLDEIQKVKQELNDEKSRLAKQEQELTTLIKKLRTKKKELDDNKKLYNSKKDSLTSQEKLLLEEKRSFAEKLNSIKNEDQKNEELKAEVFEQIDEVNNKIILIRSKNNILEKKAKEFNNKINQTLQRRNHIFSSIPQEFSSDDLTVAQEYSNQSEQLSQIQNQQGSDSKLFHKKERSYINDYLHQSLQEMKKPNMNKHSLIFQIKSEKSKLEQLANKAQELDSEERILVKCIYNKEMEQAELKNKIYAKHNNNNNNPHLTPQQSTSDKTQAQQPSTFNSVGGGAKALKFSSKTTIEQKQKELLKSNDKVENENQEVQKALKYENIGSINLLDDIKDPYQLAESVKNITNDGQDYHNFLSTPNRDVVKSENQFPSKTEFERTQNSELSQNSGIMTPHSEHMHYHVRGEFSPKRHLLAVDIDGSRLAVHQRQYAYSEMALTPNRNIDPDLSSSSPNSQHVSPIGQNYTPDKIPSRESYGTTTNVNRFDISSQKNELNHKLSVIEENDISEDRQIQQQQQQQQQQSDQMTNKLLSKYLKKSEGGIGELSSAIPRNMNQA